MASGGASGTPGQAASTRSRRIATIWRSSRCGGTVRAMSPSMAFPRPKKLYTVFGEPIYMEKLPPELDERGKRKYILDKIDEFYVKMDKEDKEKYGGNQLPEKFRQAGSD